MANQYDALTREELFRRVEALFNHNGNMTHAAKSLGLGRATFQYAIAKAAAVGIKPKRKNASVKVMPTGEIKPAMPRSEEDQSARGAAQQGYAPDYDLVHPVPDGLVLKGTSIRYDSDGAVQQYWNKTRTAGQEVEDSVQLPDPKKITKVSTLYDQQGKVTQQWVSEKPEDAQREKLWIDYAVAMASELPRVAPSLAPLGAIKDLMAAYPVGDMHIGLYSGKEETGADYGLKSCEELLIRSCEHLVASAPSCEQALVAVLGDFLHYDSTHPVTPAHGHLLDADGRSHNMVETAVRMLRYLIEAALRKHPRVHLVIEAGNHDPYSTTFLRICMAALYENEPRVTIDKSPKNFHYFEFGKNLIGTHHGHGVKMERLPLIMASDMSEAWGRTTHRYFWTGHIHHAKTRAEDFAGCTVESFRILAAPDAYASQKGYRSARDMKSIILHKTYGEVARHTVNPGMFELAEESAC